ncbi:MAG: aminopeptidase N [Candidatus Dormibacteria bacterium]
MGAATATLTRAEAGQRSQQIGGIAYAVELDLTRGEERFGFQLTAQFEGLTPGQDTFLDANLALVEETVWNGAPLDQGGRHGQRIHLPGLLSQNSVSVRGEGLYDVSGLGLHRTADPADGRIYVFSDFEPYEANRCFPCFDQPDLKGTFQFRIRVPSDWLVVAADEGEPEPVVGSDGARWWSFPPTARLAPYVLGLAMGPFHRVESRRDQTPLSLYCAQSQAAFLDQEELFQITRAGLDFFESLFAVPYPYSKYDQVFCAEKENGAMESPGCVTISDSYLFRGRTTKWDHSYRADTILHEMSHMWFGDLVTMRWWDDLWLNESFASLMATLAVDRATEYTDALVSFATRNKQLAIYHDQLRTSHPILAEVADVDQARSNFDFITYNKGAAVLRQLLAYVGEEPFFRGLHQYLEQHREANAELKDLLAAIAEASGRDLDAWGRAWLETVGINRLSCEMEGGDGRGHEQLARVVVRQEAPPGRPTLRPHRIHLGSYDWAEDRLERRATIELEVTGATTEVPDLVGQPRPALLLPNDQDLTYARIRLDSGSWSTAQANLRAISDPLARALIWDSAWDQVRCVELSASSYAELVLAHLEAETDATLIHLVLGNFRQAARRYGDPKWADALEARMAQLALGAMARAEPGSDPQMVWLHAFIRFATTEEQLRDCSRYHVGQDLPPGVALDVELRWTLVQALAQRGAAAEPEIAAALTLDSSSIGRVRAATARASLPTAAAKERAFARLGDPEVTAQEAMYVAARVGGVGHEELLLPHVRQLDQLFEHILGVHGTDFTGLAAEWLSHSLPPSQELLQVCRRYLERGQTNPALQRNFSNWLEEAERMLRARQLDDAEAGRLG